LGKGVCGTRFQSKTLESALRILRMLAAGNKTLVEIALKFSDTRPSNVYLWVKKLREMNLVDRQGDGYAIKPAGRHWLKEHGGNV